MKLKLYLNKKINLKNKNEDITFYTGSSYSDELKQVGLSESTDDNINGKIQLYHELIIQYWAWRNENSDYYGFHGKHLRFEYETQYRTLDEAVMDKDLIIPEGIEYTMWENILYKQHFKGLDKKYIARLDNVYSSLVLMHPEYSDTIKKFQRNGIVYTGNNYIIKRDLFFDYCSLLFEVLFDIEKKTDYTYYNWQEMQMFLYMAEIIFSVYIMEMLSKKPDLEIIHLPLKKIYDKKFFPIHPRYTNNGVPIAFSCNEQYMPILGVMLKSLLDNSSREYNYDLIVMQRRTESEKGSINIQKTLINKMVDEYPNASIRFVDVASIIDAEKFYVHYGYTPETYFRLFLPQILSGYKKILYMDADVIVRRDVAELYNTDLEGAIIGAVRDPIINGTAKSSKWNMQRYMSKLGIKNIYNYFQAGILIIDIDEISKNNLPKEMIDYAMSHECEMVDQDVLNLFCQDRVKFIDNKWNVDMNPDGMKAIPAAPLNVWREYQENRKSAYIYHFAGPEKPWLNPSLDKADIFWEVARETPWYEQLMASMMEHISSVKKDNAGFEWRFPYELVQAGSNIAIYGAGNVGRDFKKAMDVSGFAKVLLWVDKDYENLIELGVKAPILLKENEEIEKIVIAINNIGIVQEVKESLINLGIELKKIVWGEYRR